MNERQKRDRERSVEKQERRVEFADPERSAGVFDSHVITKAKKDFINYLWAGDDIRTAAGKALGDEVNALKRINYLREQDQQFDQQVELQLDLIRKEWLPQLEENMFQQALGDSVSAGNLALRLAERLDPDVWGKPTAEMVVRKPKGDDDHHLSEWFDDPRPIEATYRDKENE